MKKVKFNNIEVEFDNGIAKISATIENSTFNTVELKYIIGAILQNLTNVGDMYRKPIIDNISINGAIISGQQKS